VESFAIHVRQLIEFLTSPVKRGNATAGDFTRAKWTPPENAAELERLKKRLSKQVAHLTRYRGTTKPEDRIVWTREAMEKLTPELLRFLDAADPDRLCDGFIDAARASLAPAEPSILIDIRPSPYHGGTATTGLT
jgi:hypothetical protein